MIQGQHINIELKMIDFGIVLKKNKKTQVVPRYGTE